jgi:ATP-binding cassette subfamily F protein uup
MAELEQSNNARGKRSVITTLPEAPIRKKLSYMEAREYASIEERIARVEERVALSRSAMDAPEIQTNAQQLLAAQAEFEESQRELDSLYSRWAELEEKKG